MSVTFDPAKRDWTLATRGLDFADAAGVIEGSIFEFIDARFEYGEQRITTIGYVNERMVVVIWTERERNYHVISMRKANQREQARYGRRLD